MAKRHRQSVRRLVPNALRMQRPATFNPGARHEHEHEDVRSGPAPRATSPNRWPPAQPICPVVRHDIVGVMLKATQVTNKLVRPGNAQVVSSISRMRPPISVANV
jgi:hypothetical protein